MRGRRDWVVALLGLAGCLAPERVVCENGRICPAGNACDLIHDRCVLPEQLTVCGAAGDGSPCSFAGVDGLCRDQVCLRRACGDGFALDSEQCDGQDLRGRGDCVDHGFYEPGPVTCTDACVYDVTSCARYCGDGVVDPGESCDGPELGLVDGVPATCRALGFYDEPGLVCSPLCRHDVAGCTGFCGDAAVNGNELCDGADPDAASCLDFGHDRGTLSCTGVCGVELGACATIGWRRIAPSDPGIVRALWGATSTDLHATSTGTTGPRFWRFDGTSWTEVALGPIPPPPGAGAGGYVGLEGAWRAPGGAVWTVGYYIEDTVIAPHAVSWDGVAWTAATLPAGVRLYAVDGVSDDDVYAVGRDQVVHFDGTTWTEVLSVAPATLYGVWAGATDDVRVVGAGGRAYHFDGDAWTLEATGTSASLRAVWGAATDDVWAVGAGGVILHHDGTGWSQLPVAPTSSDLVSVFGTGPDAVFAGATDGTILRYDGARWTRLVTETSGSILDFWGDDPGDLHAVGSGQFLRSAGDAWALPDVPTTSGALVDLWTSPSGEAVLAGTDVWRFDGDQWIAAGLPFPLYGWYEALWVTAPTDVYAGGGELHHFDGVDWTLTDPGFDVVAIWSPALDDVFVAGFGGAIARGSAAGWTPMISGTTAFIDALWGASATDVFAVGSDGTILRFDGDAWTPMASPTTEHLHAVAGSSATDVWAVGDGGTILHFDGVTWSVTPSGSGEPLYDVVALPGEAFAAGAFGTLLRHDGDRWSPVRVPDGASFFGLSAHDGVVYVTGAGGRAYALQRELPW